MRKPQPNAYPTPKNRCGLLGFWVGYSEKHKMRLPDSLFDLVLEFHDEYDCIDKKKRVNFIINAGYRIWIVSQGCYVPVEALIRRNALGYSIYNELISNAVFPNNCDWWWYISCFHTAERQMNLHPYSTVWLECQY